MESGIAEQQLIAVGDIESPAARGRSPETHGRPIPVIVDSGSRAEVVVMPAGVVVGIGTRFRHRNAVWVIVGRRPGSGIFVAEPAEH